MMSCLELSYTFEISRLGLSYTLCDVTFGTKLFRCAMSGFKICFALFHVTFVGTFPVV
jgi:hypothetical protein